MRVADDLKPHNRETIRRILEFYKTKRKCCAIQATGTGKTFLILRLLEILNNEGKMALIFAPNREIIKQTKNRMKEFNLNNACFDTYKHLSLMSDDDIANIKTDFIICDELHRTGAPTWGEHFSKLVDLLPNVKVFGVTATPVRCVDGRDMAEEYFDNNKACNISLAEALVREIIPVMPIYISALYTFEEEYRNMSDKIDRANNSDEEKIELQRELLAAKQQLEKANGVSEIIKKYITNYNGKYLVFCKDKKHLYAMKDVVIGWFRDAGYNGNIFEYAYYSNDKTVKDNLDKFKNNKDNGVKLLFVIDKLNEGLHLKEIQGCFLLRPTCSNITYYQQIGRAIDAGSKEKRIIFDLVCNFNNLRSFNLKKELEEKIKERQSGKFSDCTKEFELDKFDVVDCVQECVNVFNKIDSKIHLDLERWTDEEDNIIIEQYPKIGSKVLELLRYRTEKAIYHRAEVLGVYKVDEWTQEEIVLLKQLYPKYSIKCFKKFNKSVSSIVKKVGELGLRSEKYWTDEDIKLLEEKYPIMGSDCIKYFPNRDRKLIQEKARKLGIKCVTKAKQNWTEEEINLLKDTFTKYGSECIKYFPNRKEKSVLARAYSLGLKQGKKTSKYKYVSWNKNSNAWQVVITCNGKQMFFGTFNDEDEAGRVAMEKAKEYGKAV